MTTCKVRRALYARITLDMFRVGSFKAALWAFDAHDATCPVCRRERNTLALAPWRRRGVKRLTWRYRFPVRAFNVRRGLYRAGALEPCSIWYRLGGSHV